MKRSCNISRRRCAQASQLVSLQHEAVAALNPNQETETHLRVTCV